jgi:hypothetical protein
LEKDIFFLVYRKVTFGGGSIRTKEEFIGWTVENVQKQNKAVGWDLEISWCSIFALLAK